MQSNFLERNKRTKMEEREERESVHVGWGVNKILHFKYFYIF